ncbi:MAG: zinc-binding dehydrogenase [Bacteroidota bacterium]
MTSKIKQVTFSQYGNPEVLQVAEVEQPLAKAGEVLVKVSVIGVNYSDVLRRKNIYFMPTPLPFVLGTEAVGVIEEVGEGVSEPFSVGTRVLAILPQAGGYATYVSANAQYCVPLPPTIDDKTATAIFVQGTTAQLMVSQIAKELTDKTVLVNASAGGVGSILVQLAKLNGAKVIGASSSDAKLKVATALGADAGVNYTRDNWREDVKRANDGKGVDVVFEMVGGEVYNKSIRSLAPGGHMIVYGCASGIQGSIHPEHFVDENLTQSGFNLAYFIQHKPAVWQKALGTVIELLAQGKIKIETPKTFALEEAAEAHRQIEARQTTGKVVLLT